MRLDQEQLEQIEAHITEILPDLLLRNPAIATTIEGILAQHFPRRDEFARLLDEFTGFRQETRERFDRVDQDIHELKADVSQLKTDVSQLKTDVSQLKTDMGRLNGRTLQQLVRERLPIYLSRFALRVRSVDSAQIAELLEQAAEEERISEKEMEDAKLIDAVAHGRRRADRVDIYLAGEVSSAVNGYDLERARRRAAIIERAVQMPTLPVVLGEKIPEQVRSEAEAVNAGWVVIPTEG
jgi:outer membrane murein-binding lipoprotein Lpp